MTNPLVSVIIPNYNHARYLDERIQSVLRQTYQNFEIIILDDCSPDNGASRAVIEHYRDNKHISHIVYNDQNSGSPFLQWNKGFELAKGDLVWIAESDDKCEPNFLETLITFFKENVCVAFCGSISFNDHGLIAPFNCISYTDKIYNSKEFIANNMLCGKSIANASSAIFSKKALNLIKHKYKSYKASGDRMFWLEMAEVGNIAYCNKKLNYYRTHASNSTKKTLHNGINQKEDKTIIDYILKKGYITKSQYRKYVKRYVTINIFELINDPSLKKELYKVWNFNIIEQYILRLKYLYTKFHRHCHM